MNCVLRADTIADGVQRPPQRPIGYPPVTGVQALHELLQPKIRFLDRGIEDVETCRHAASS
jgi:hypothetical protein